MTLNEVRDKLLHLIFIELRIFIQVELEGMSEHAFGINVHASATTGSTGTTAFVTAWTRTTRTSWSTATRSTLQPGPPSRPPGPPLHDHLVHLHDHWPTFTTTWSALGPLVCIRVHLVLRLGDCLEVDTHLLLTCRHCFCRESTMLWQHS